MSKEYSSIIPTIEGTLVQTLIDKLEDYYRKRNIKILKYKIKNSIQTVKRGILKTIKKLKIR
jgi:hypothetical protein